MPISIIMAFAPFPWLAKLIGLCAGAALMLLEHYIEWVVIPQRKNRAMLRDKRPHQSPGTVEEVARSPRRQYRNTLRSRGTRHGRIR